MGDDAQETSGEQVTLPPPLYMEDMIVALTRALRDFDRENAVAADRHEPGCLCALCAFVRDVRSTLEET